MAFAQSSQVVNRHGRDAANRDCAHRCCRKQAQGHIFHRKISFFFEKPDHRHRRMLRTRNEWSPLIVDGFLNRVLEAADRILNLASDLLRLK